MSDFDILIRGGMIVDGTGGPRREADLGIRSGRVAAIGELSGASADRVIDASGLIVAPGVIDPHTHYDAQLYWDPYCTNSGWHGVTSVVVGNCGFGFSPCRAEDRDRYMLMMENTEQIPAAAMRTALPWDWETYPEWVQSVRSVPKGVNVGSFLPLNSLLIWVMGYEAAKTRPATEEERAEMRRLLHEAMDAGAMGFGFSYLQASNSHKDVDGSPMPSDSMAIEEAYNLAKVLAERGEGVIQALVEIPNRPEVNRDVVERLAEISGRPVLHTVTIAIKALPDLHKQQLAWLDSCVAKGLNVYSQALQFRSISGPTPIKDMDLAAGIPAFAKFQYQAGDIEARIDVAKDPDYRDMVAEPAAAMLDASTMLQYLLLDSAGGAAEYEGYEGQSFQEIAEAEGKRMVDVFFDVAIASRLEAEVRPQGGGDYQVPAEWAAEVNAHPRVLPGTSDGGAHVKFWSGGQYGSDLISWLVREEELLTLEELHHKLSGVPADALQWEDRGTLVEGKAADIMIYDFDTIGHTGKYDTVHDLPGGDWRRVARAVGIRWVLVNGEPTFIDNECTGATPGNILATHGALTNV